MDNNPKVITDLTYNSLEELKQPMSFERLVTTISTRFINIDPAMIDIEIGRTLKTIGRFVDVDRCYIFQLLRDGEFLRNTHEWCLDGIAAQIDFLKGLRTSDYPWKMNKLRQLQTINIPRLEDLPKEALAEYELFSFQDIKSCVMVPMAIRGALKGFIGFDSVNTYKTWSMEDIALLVIIGEVIVNALERKRIEEELHRTNDKIAHIIDTLGEDYFVYYHDTRGVFTYVSPSITNVLGYSPDEFMTYYEQQLTSNPINREARRRTELSIKGKRQEPYEVEVFHKNGSTVVLECNEISVRYDQGEVVAVEGLAHNITKRKMIEDSIRRRNEELDSRVRERTAELNEVNMRLMAEVRQHERAQERIRTLLQEQQTIFDSVPALIFYRGADHRFIQVNKAYAELFGRTKKEMEGKTEQEIGIDPGLVEVVNLEDDYIIRTGNSKRQILRKIVINGSPVWTVTDKIPYRDIDGTIIGVIGFSLDISDYKKAEEMIVSLGQKLIKTQELERLRISRYLHDSVAQNLSLARIDCEMLINEHAKDLPDLRADFDRLSDTILKSIAEVRDLSYGLRPPELDEMGLVRTVFQSCTEFSERYGIPVDFYSAGMERIALDFEAEINLYRIFQEAMNNIRKHAGASCVTVRIVASYPDIIMRIEDNGMGFKVPDHYEIVLNNRRMGLQSMEERARILKGHLQIQSRPGKGTKILVEIPIDHKETEGEQQ